MFLEFLFTKLQVGQMKIKHKEKIGLGVLVIEEMSSVYTSRQKEMGVAHSEESFCYHFRLDPISCPTVS